MTDTTKLKDSLHHIIDQIEDQATLEAVLTLLSPKVGTIYNGKGKSLNQEQIEDLLEESEEDIKANSTVSHRELKTHIQSWRNQNSAK